MQNGVTTLLLLGAAMGIAVPAAPARVLRRPSHAAARPAHPPVRRSPPVARAHAWPRPPVRDSHVLAAEAPAGPTGLSIVQIGTRAILRFTLADPCAPQVQLWHLDPFGNQPFAPAWQEHLPRKPRGEHAVSLPATGGQSGALWLARVTVGAHSADIRFSAAPPATAAAVIPQIPGGVAPLGQPLSAGLCLHNASDAPSAAQVSWQLVSEIGRPLDHGAQSWRLGAGESVTQVIALGRPGRTGPLTARFRISGLEGAGLLEALVGCVPRPDAGRSSENPFGLSGPVPLELAAAVGARWWSSAWPDLNGRHWNDRSDSTATDADALLSSADRLGVSIVSCDADPLLAGGSMDDTRAAMSHFIRRMGAWQLAPAAGAAEYAAALQQFWSTSKRIHKDATTLMAPPGGIAETVDFARKLANDGAADATDVLCFSGVGESGAPDSDRAALSELTATRDELFPAKPVWDVGASLPPGTKQSVAPNLLIRSLAVQLAHGVDRVFWTACPDLVTPSGEATAALFAYATAAAELTGTEFAGSLPWPQGTHALVFQRVGKPILVAWADSGVKQVALPGAGRAEAVDPFGERATLARLDPEKITLTATPIFVTGLGSDILDAALAHQEPARLAEAQSAAQAAGISVDLSGGPGPDLGAAAIAAAADRYRDDPEARGRVLTFLDRLEGLMDLQALRDSFTGATSQEAAYHALDVTNHAIADLREPIVLKEGDDGYLRGSRAILAIAERRVSLGRIALIARDYGLARAHAEQATALALAGQKLVPVESVWYPSRELRAGAASSSTGS